jgi:hypothetical protein
MRRVKLRVTEEERYIGVVIKKISSPLSSAAKVQEEQQHYSTN